MSREILFRGKRIKTGKWINGDLIQLHEESPYWYILPEGVSSEMYEDEPYDFRENDVMCSVALSKIIPETIGQFTGLCDKNGTKIFEGDIVRFLDKDWEAGGIATVDYEYGKWKINGQYITKISSIVWLDLYRNDLEYEVIGNVTDNPELLEVGE